ncbi:uncharacterized protein (DUF305 family) [Actinoplanes campanulatus]|uniref:Uncharacterized protein (DUF305 family) n=1 Tax=Actinoplanes campanulatus TaxID=113559 RepID=A0A7W5FH69_9ACTN|nr:DUF305 domain-containing protein [Actinoplanes campanulatus]MBB3098261.1 uncharacterized protein (DUF305 family) [Actinoplanes campanulatus]GGN34692.1 DUF305 domain-containing protein [Actinoplanes campanulatus]GID38780.1 DUF305 domain-containing protein [Actinoplanes campanulatus]
MKARHVAALVVAAAPFLLGACGTAVDKKEAAPAATTQAQNVKNVSEITAGSTFNDTDVMFLQMLIDNQQQGQQMAQIAAKRAGRPEVVELAKAVQVTQADEIKMMTNWLTEWGKPATLDERTSLHADHGGLPATSEKEIAALKTMKKAQFETAFLNLFLGHQHNAVEFAQLELSKGGNEQAKAFAERVKQSRSDQVQQMLKLLAG